MTNISEKLKSLQIEINKVKYGHCLLIKLINCGSPYYNISKAIKELAKIILPLCTAKLSQMSYNQLYDDAVILLLPGNHSKETISNIAFHLYQATQLSLNIQLNTNFNCKIASAILAQSTANAEEIYYALTNLLIYSKDASYHQEYNKQSYENEANRVLTEYTDLNILRQNLVNNTVRFAYQPIIDKKNGKVIYYECLLRFVDSNNKLVSFAPIIKATESSGLINIVNYKALEMVVQQLAKTSKINLAFNLSPVGILEDNMLKIIESLLSKYKVASRLIIEITETSLNENYEKTKPFIEKLRAHGCRFALDDFGAGFTSFKQLKSFKLDYIKIDGSYISDIIDNPISKHFVKAIVEIAQDLGMKTIAEFVENAKIAQFLDIIKVDYMQGNFFSPASINNITELE